MTQPVKNKEIKKAFFYFFEDYSELIFAIAREFKSRCAEIEFSGISARRRTSLALVEKFKNEVSISSCDWLGDLEAKWLAQPVSDDELERYEKLIGTKNMRHLISCDRELGHGFMSGGVYAQTNLRRAVENNEKLRWRYVVGVLSYYEKTFLRDKPDFIFFSELTMAYELAAFFIAEVLSIPCLCLSYSRFGNVIMVDDNPYNQYSSVKSLFEKSLTYPEVLSEKYCLQAREFVKKFRNRPEVPAYSKFFLKEVAARAGIWRMLRTLLVDLLKWAAIIFGLKGTKGFLRQRHGLDILCLNLNIWWQNRKLLWGISYFEKPNRYLNEKYFYYPLHVEPEASTMVFSPNITNQLTVIEQISRAMPAGYKLLVKEHLPTIGRRPMGFYKKIRNFPDVQLISPLADGFTLLKNSMLNIVITGTAGWESILFEKPTLVIGGTQYDSLNDGFEKLESLMGIEEKLKAAMKMRPVANENLIKFIASTLQVGIQFPIEAYAYAHYGVDGKALMEENKHAIKGLVERMRSMIAEYQASATVNLK